MSCFPRVMAAAAGIAALTLPFHCAQLAGSDGNGSNVGNARVTGVLYHTDGTRARAATVTAVPVDLNPLGGLSRTAAMTAVRSTVTDDTGGYSFDSLPYSAFNLLGSDGNNLLFIDSVSSGSAEPTIIPPDTLRAPGSIRGVVRLQPRDDSRNVLILFMGTTTWTAPEDTGGNFSATNLAKGRYRVRVISTNAEYLPLDTHLTVLNGKNSVIADTLHLDFTGVPTPAGLTASYDTLMQVTTLTWNRAPTGAVNGYIVYRRNLDSSTTPAIALNRTLLTDTLYRDSLTQQGNTYDYHVIAVDENGRESRKSALVQVMIAGIFTPFDSIVKGNGTLPGQFGYLSRVAVDSIGNFYISDTKNNRVQKFDIAGTLCFADSSFSLPTDVELTGNGNLLVADYDNREVATIQPDGTRGATIETRAGPLGVTTLGERQFVLSGSGIELYESSGYVRTISLQQPVESGAIETDAQGNLLVLADGTVTLRDAQGATVAELFLQQDYSSQQNGRIAAYGAGLFLLMTNNQSGPFFTRILAIDYTGAIRAQWGCERKFRDLCVMRNGNIACVSDDGVIQVIRSIRPLR